MNNSTSSKLVVLVNYLSKNYFYSPLYVKGAEEAVFLTGSPKQDYQLIIITSENMIDYLARQKLLKKTLLVVDKLDDKPKKILILGYNPKKYEGKENNIDIYHLFDDNIPEYINDLFPTLQDLELFDEFVLKIEEAEKEAKERDRKENRIEDDSKLFNFSKNKFTNNYVRKTNNKDYSLITRSFFTQNVITKGLLIMALISILFLQFFLSVPTGSVIETKPVAFGALYFPFVFGYEGYWRFLTYIFISNSIFTFIFVGIAFYFFSRMSESFYGVIRYIIIVVVGSILAGLIATQLFPDSVFYGMSIPLWTLIGSTGTFVVMKWRNIAKSIKIRYFVYAFLVLFMFLVLGSFGARIEAGLIALVVGIVLGLAVQFRTDTFKINWKKSINPIIAITLLSLTAIILPAVSKRKIPLNSSILNQSVFVTYKRFKMIRGTAKNEFNEMNKKFYEIPVEKSNCLWNMSILFVNKLDLNEAEKLSLNQAITSLNKEYVKADTTVVNKITADLDLMISKMNKDTETDVFNAATSFKSSYADFSKAYTSDSMKVLSERYEVLSTALSKEILTPQIQIHTARAKALWKVINAWYEIGKNKKELKVSGKIEEFITKPSAITQVNVRNASIKLGNLLRNKDFNIDFSSFLSVFTTKMDGLNTWCFIPVN